MAGSYRSAAAAADTGTPRCAIRLDAVCQSTYGVADAGNPSLSAAGCHTLWRQLEIRTGVPEGAAVLRRHLVLQPCESETTAQLLHSCDCSAGVFGRKLDAIFQRNRSLAGRIIM